MVDRINLEREREISAVTEHWHLEQVKSTSKGDVIDPLWHRPIVPHFPEKSASDPRGKQDDHRVPLIARDLLGNAWLVEERIDRIEGEEDSDPHERKEIVRNGNGKYE